MEPIAEWTMDSAAGEAVGVVENILRSSSATTSTASLGDINGSNCNGEVAVLDLPVVSGFAQTPTPPEANAGPLQEKATDKRKSRAPCVAELLLATRLRRATHDDPRGMVEMGWKGVAEGGTAGEGRGRWMRSSMLRAPHATTDSTTQTPPAVTERELARISVGPLTVNTGDSFTLWDPTLCATSSHATVEVAVVMAMAQPSHDIRQPLQRLRISAESLPRRAEGGGRACRQRGASPWNPGAAAETEALQELLLGLMTTGIVVGTWAGMVPSVRERSVTVETTAALVTADVDTHGASGRMM